MEWPKAGARPWIEKRTSLRVGGTTNRSSTSSGSKWSKDRCLLDQRMHTS
jgi:hypothetical protein